VAAVAMAAGAGLTYWWMTRSQPDQVPPAPTEATEGAVRSNRPQREPWELPTLDNSDSIFRDAVAVLSQHPLLSRLLAGEGLVRVTALAVVQIGDGHTPAIALGALRPASHVSITGGDQGPIDVASYERWDRATNALVSVAPVDAAQLYVNVKPLFDAAYADLGHPGGDFDDAIARALDMVIATPQPATSPVLLRRPDFFVHDDAALRALRPVQKQFLLIGPDNQRRVTTWLRQLANALDIRIE